MKRPDMFGSVYAMHPVGTGSGVGVSAEIPKWICWRMQKVKMMCDGGPFGESDWGVEGRIYTEVMPFFAKTLVFDDGRQTGNLRRQ